MKKLKELRETMKITQQDLAKALHTTQQTIARWESDQSEPSISALKDLALFFQTSVDDLLEYSKTGKSIRSSLYWMGEEDRDGFWGQVGIKVANKPSVWFPITANTAELLEGSLDNVECDEKWISFPTLANQYVCIHPSQVTSVTLLDEAEEYPEDDCELTYPEEGLPLELYRGFANTYLTELSKEKIEKIVKLYEKKEKNALTKDEDKFYTNEIKALKQNLDGNPSEHFIHVLLEQFLAEGMIDYDKYDEYMSKVKVYFTDGQQRDFVEDSENCIDNVDKLDDSTCLHILNFNTNDEGLVLAPSSKIAMISMPYLGILDEEKKFEEELEKK